MTAPHYIQRIKRQSTTAQTAMYKVACVKQRASLRLIGGVVSEEVETRQQVLLDQTAVPSAQQEIGTRTLRASWLNFSLRNLKLHRSLAMWVLTHSNTWR